MKPAILFFTVIYSYFVFFSDFGAQQWKGQMRPSQEMTHPQQVIEHSTAIEQQREKQVSVSQSPPATVTFLDGSTQKWENLKFVYEWEREYADDLHPRTSSLFLYLANSRFGIYDRVHPTPGFHLEADYTEQLKFKHILLKGEPAIEGRIIGTSCERDSPCLYAKGIAISGVCSAAGQRKECFAYLVYLKGATAPNKENLVKEIVFIEH